jgi:tRNA (guanine-N7-)-methyltransferase
MAQPRHSPMARSLQWHPVNTPDSPLEAPASPSQDIAHPRAIRTFVKRAGRTTFGQARAFDTLGPRFLLPYRSTPMHDADWDTAFEAMPARQGPAARVLEIGFGMGEATAHIATVLPEVRFLCCEVHEPGVGALLKRIGENDIRNIRICAHDAVQVLEHMLTPESLDGIHIFFPDPWHKKRHHKRRLIQPALVEQLASRLKPGGYIHCATDWQPYAQQMLQVFRANALLHNSSDSLDGWADKPAYRPLTKFENRGLRLGHGVWDLVFVKKGC